MKLTLNKVGEQAFTILEVVIVLTITALMVIIAIQQLSGRTDAVRYRDSVAQFESFVNQQISEVTQGADLSGIDLTGGCGNTNTECIYIGRVLEFNVNSSDVLVHTMIGGLQFSSVADGIRRSENLQEVIPRSARVDTERLDWQLSYIGAPVSVDGAPEPAASNNLYIGFFRLPSSTEVFPILFSGDQGSISSIEEIVNYSPRPGEANRSTSNENFAATLCFRGINGKEARVFFGTDLRNEAVSVDRDFDTNECMDLNI